MANVRSEETTKKVTLQIPGKTRTGEDCTITASLAVTCQTKDSHDAVLKTYWKLRAALERELGIDVV